MNRSTHRPPYQYMLEQLRAARREAGLTQEAVAQLLSTTQAFISKVERGERRIDPVELAEFAAVYEKEVDYFLLRPALSRPKAVERTVQLSGEAAVAFRTLAYDRGESEEALIRDALEAHVRRTDPASE